MRTVAVAAIVFALAFVSCANAEVMATYDPATGDVSFSDVSAMVGLRINSLDGSLIAGEITDLGGAASGPFAVVNDQAPAFVEWGNLLGMSFANASGGAILPLGLKETVAGTGQNENYQVLARSSAAPTVDIPVVMTGFLPVPEPVSLALVGLGIVGLAAVRRR